MVSEFDQFPNSSCTSGTWVYFREPCWVWSVTSQYTVVYLPPAPLYFNHVTRVALLSNSFCPKTKKMQSADEETTRFHDNCINILRESYVQIMLVGLRSGIIMQRFAAELILVLKSNLVQTLKVSSCRETVMVSCMYVF